MPIKATLPPSSRRRSKKDLDNHNIDTASLAPRRVALGVELLNEREGAVRVLGRWENQKAVRVSREGKVTVSIRLASFWISSVDSL